MSITRLHVSVQIWGRINFPISHILYPIHSDTLSVDVKKEYSIVTFIRRDSFMVNCEAVSRFSASDSLPKEHKSLNTSAHQEVT